MDSRAYRECEGRSALVLLEVLVVEAEEQRPRDDDACTLCTNANLLKFVAAADAAEQEEEPRPRAETAPRSMQLRTKGNDDDDGEAPDADVVPLSVDDRDEPVVSDGATLKARDEEDALLRFKPKLGIDNCLLSKSKKSPSCYRTIRHHLVLPLL